MFIMKFGGTSVGTKASIVASVDICQSALSQKPVAVFSAMAGVTNALVQLLDQVRQRQTTEVDAALTALEHRHAQTLEEIGHTAEADTGMQSVFTDLRALVTGSMLLGECSPRVCDAVLATGELLSTWLVWAECQRRGIQAVRVDARQLIITDDQFGCASVLRDQTKLAAHQHIPKGCELVITQGFIGSTVSGVTTTLGRGGSDYTAALLGASLGASEVQIWTDVDGIMTTDPRIEPKARSIPHISYAEAAELAYFGAKVVHPATIAPAVETGIPVLVKNTHNPSHPGTRVHDGAQGVGLRAISGRKGVTIISVSSSRMLNAWGFLHHIFEIFAKHRVIVDLIATSEVSVSVTVESKNDLVPLAADLSHIGQVKIEAGMAIMCLVGQDLWKESERIVRVFQALPGYKIRLISMGASEINLGLVLAEEQLNRAIQAVHQEFFGGQNGPHI